MGEKEATPAMAAAAAAAVLSRPQVHTAGHRIHSSKPSSHLLAVAGPHQVPPLAALIQDGNLIQQVVAGAAAGAGQEDTQAVLHIC
jgi:hypothetical protein